MLYAKLGELPDALRVEQALSGLAVVGYAPGLVGASASATGPASTGAGQRGSRASTISTIDVGSPLSASDSASVVLVTGSNMAVNPPAGPPSTSAPASSSTKSAVPSGQGVGSSTTTTVPGPFVNNPNLAVPTSATEPLQPWDPRSCTAVGTAGP